MYIIVHGVYQLTGVDGARDGWGPPFKRFDYFTSGCVSLTANYIHYLDSVMGAESAAIIIKL